MSAPGELLQQMRAIPTGLGHCADHAKHVVGVLRRAAPLLGVAAEVERLEELERELRACAERVATALRHKGIQP